jgi:hypothetical protein
MNDNNSTGMPPWATESDDSMESLEGHPMIGYFGDGDAHFIRFDTFDSDGYHEGELQVSVWFGDEVVHLPLAAVTGENFRHLADELYRLSYDVDAEQGAPVTPDETTVTDRNDPLMDGEVATTHRFQFDHGTADVFFMGDEEPQIGVNVDDRRPVTRESLDRMVRRLHAAEAFRRSLTPRPNLRIVD